MPTIKVVKRFMLRLDPKQINEVVDPYDRDRMVPVFAPAETITFDQPGEYDVAEEVANHWYTLMHLEGYEPPPPTPGMAEYQVAKMVATPVKEEESSQPAPADTFRTPRPALPPASATRATPNPTPAREA